MADHTTFDQRPQAPRHLGVANLLPDNDFRQNLGRGRLTSTSKRHVTIAMGPSG